ncbi:MAG: YHS domain-containing protein [Candidatus Thermoplasmatota archaeon]
MGLLDRFKKPAAAGTAVDPVCKMNVDMAKPPGGKSEHAGQTYYFCAPGCKRSFDKDPHKFLGSHGH